VAAATAVGALWLAPGCSGDIFDVSVDLRPEAFSFDLGSPEGTIPTVACDPGAPDTCAVAGADTVQATAATVAGPAQVQVSLGCDGGSGRCFAEADARLPLTVDVSEDEGFTGAAEDRAISFVRVADIAYTVPTNTLTFDVPTIDVYVGPPGVTSEADPQAAFVDHTGGISAMSPVSEPRHLVVTHDSPAGALIETSIRDRKPFVVLLVAKPHVNSGAPVPAGALEVDLFPRVTLGFPR
jgi:hypothetical protein